MKKLALLAITALFSAIAVAGEPMATLKFVTNQINRLDKRIDESAIPPGYETFTNKAATAVQPLDPISSLSNDVGYVTESITNNLVAKSEVNSLATGKRDKEDLAQYIKCPIFYTNPVEQAKPEWKPYTVYPVRSANQESRYLWILVDKDGLATTSADSYDNIESLSTATNVFFGYKGGSFGLTATESVYAKRIYVGDGSAFSSYSIEDIGRLATEQYASALANEAVSTAVETAAEYTDGKTAGLATETKATEIAEEVVTSKGYATETYVTSNYYDKGTVDEKISAATPEDYENVKSKALSAVQEEVDPTIKAWAKADTKPSYTTDELDTYNKATIDSKDAALQAQIEAMTAFDVKEVDVLPEQGEPGYIYLVPDPDSPGDKVNWIWIVDSVTHVGRWVKVGSTRVNLSEYAKKATTLEGYGITDAYTKVDADAKILAATKYKSSIRATSPIGRFVPDEKTGYVDINLAGMTIQEGLEFIVSETLNPGLPTLPSIKSVSLTGAGEKEVGTTFSPTFSVSTDNGKYDYGPDPTGSTFDRIIVKDSVGHASTNSTTGSFAQFNVQDNTSYKIWSIGHYTQGSLPRNNKGQNVTNAELRIQAMWWDGRGSEVSADKKESDVVTGFRQWFSHIGTVVRTVDSTLLWSSEKRGNAKNASTVASIEIPSGTKLIAFALPKPNSALGYKKTITSVIDIDGMGLDILNRFTVDETYVTARDSAKAGTMLYKTWTFSSPGGLQATHLKVVIADAPSAMLTAMSTEPTARDASGYQPCNNLNNNLNRQNAGPLDVSQLFYSGADLNYYITKGRLATGVSPYWTSKVPYPYPGQVVASHFGGETRVYTLKPNLLGEYDTVEFTDRDVAEEIAKEVVKEAIPTKWASSNITNANGIGLAKLTDYVYGTNRVVPVVQFVKVNGTPLIPDPNNAIDIPQSSVFKVVNGKYITGSEEEVLVYNGRERYAAVIDGTVFRGVTFNENTGNCTGGKLVLNGTFAGATFENDEFTLVSKPDGTAQCTTQKSGVTYTMTYSSPTVPDDTIKYLSRGTLVVSNGTTSAKTTAYTFFEVRDFEAPELEIDQKPQPQHAKSIVSSKGVYDFVTNRVSKAGDTLYGDYEFDPDALTEDGAWYYHQYGFSTALSYSLGSVFNFEQDGTAFTYDGGLMGADRGREAGSIKYPMTLFFARLKTKPDTTTTSEAIHYTIDGVSQEYAVVPSAYSTVELKLPKGADGKMKAGTIAVAEDYTSTISDVQDIKNNGASKVKNVLGFKNSAATTTKLATFDGSSELAVVKGENMKFTAATGSPNSLTIDVDTNKIATTEFAQNVTPYWVVTPEDTRRMSGDGRTQRRRPVFKVKYNNVDVVFGLDQMRICEVDDDGYITRMQFVNGSRVLDYQNASAFYFWPNSSYSGKYFYIGKYSPYFTDTPPMQPAGGASGSAILYQTGVAGGWFNAENITAEGLTWDEYWELKDDITDASETAHEELVAVSNSLSTVRSDRIYNIGRTGRFARYRVTRTQFGNTYVFDFELRADNKREVTTGTWYDGTLVEQKQGPTPTELTFRMIAYNGSYAGTYAFYISIDENGDTTAKMAMPTELFPMAVGETKDLSVMTVTKLSQADQVVDSYLYGDLTVRKTSDDSVIDRVPTSSEFDFTDDLYRTLTPTDNIERVKAVLNGLIEKMKSVGQIERN